MCSFSAGSVTLQWSQRQSEPDNCASNIPCSAKKNYRKIANLVWLRLRIITSLYNAVYEWYADRLPQRRAAGTRGDRGSPGTTGAQNRPLFPVDAAVQVELLSVGPEECYVNYPVPSVGETWWVSKLRCTDEDGVDVAHIDPTWEGPSDDPNPIDSIRQAQLTP